MNKKNNLILRFATLGKNIFNKNRLLVFANLNLLSMVYIEARWFSISIKKSADNSSDQDVEMGYSSDESEETHNRAFRNISSDENAKSYLIEKYTSIKQKHDENQAVIAEDSELDRHHDRIATQGNSAGTVTEKNIVQEEELAHIGITNYYLKEVANLNAAAQSSKFDLSQYIVPANEVIKWGDETAFDNKGVTNISKEQDLDKPVPKQSKRSGDALETSSNEPESKQVKRSRETPMDYIEDQIGSTTFDPMDPD